MVDFDSSEGKHPASPQSGFLVVRLAGDLHQLIAGLQHLHSRRVLHSDIKAPGRKYGMGWWLWRKDFVAKQLKMVWYYILGSWWFLFTAFFFIMTDGLIEGVSCYLATWRLLLRVSKGAVHESRDRHLPRPHWGWLGNFSLVKKAFPPTVWGSSRPPWVFYAPPRAKYIFYGYRIPVTSVTSLEWRSFMVGNFVDWSQVVFKCMLPFPKIPRQPFAEVTLQKELAWDR